MEQKLYSIYMYGSTKADRPIASDMTLDTALMLLRSLIETYWQETTEYILSPQ